MDKVVWKEVVEYKNRSDSDRKGFDPKYWEKAEANQAIRSAGYRISIDLSQSTEWHLTCSFSGSQKAAPAEEGVRWRVMIRFEDRGDFFELDLASEETDDLPSRGDGYVTVAVSSKEYSGKNDLWVDHHSLMSFCSALIALERTRSGEAILESMIPDELRIRVFSVDSFGHMAVEGITGYHVHREHKQFWHSVSFGFEFEPSQLLTAVRADWVKNIGGGPVATTDG